MSQQRTLQGIKSNLILKRNLRGQMTLAEKKLWLKLRGRQLNSFKFRRQHGIGTYVVDFFCPEKKLAIEVDGDIHVFKKQMEQDRKREDFLKGLGIKMIRYKNNDILNNIEGVMENLYGEVVEFSTSPNPSFTKAGRCLRGNFQRIKP